MKTIVVPAHKLSKDLVRRWAEIQQQNLGLASPYFRPEFTQAVARVRNDVFVAIIDDGDAFFPFQRHFVGLGRPVGGLVSDYHGLIAPSNYRCDVKTLVQTCGLRSWSFDYLPMEQTMFAPWGRSDGEALVVDIAESAQIGSSKLRANCNRRRRLLEAVFGSVEVELDTCDPSVLNLCLKWKSAQYHRTGNLDLFAKPWARSLIDLIASHHEPEFAGMLSVLRAGGQPIAAHFGMKSGSALHHWFPAHDPEFQRYSPGMILLMEMITGAMKLGIKSIDLGSGDYDFKRRLSNRKVSLIKGAVVADPVTSLLREACVKGKDFAKAAPILKSIIASAHRVYKNHLMS